MKDKVFRERMIKFLDLLLRKRQPGDRTITAVQKELDLYSAALKEIAAYAIAMEWIRIKPVGSAKIYSITQLGRVAIQQLKSTTEVSS